MNLFQTKILAIIGATFLLTSCADGPWLLEAMDKQSFVGKHIDAAYQSEGRIPDYIGNRPDGGGKEYGWVEDKRYLSTKPIGTTRQGNTVTYHHQKVTVGSVMRREYITDHSDIIRDIKYLYVR